MLTVIMECNHSSDNKNLAVRIEFFYDHEICPHYLSLVAGVFVEGRVSEKKRYWDLFIISDEDMTRHNGRSEDVQKNIIGGSFKCFLYTSWIALRVPPWDCFHREFSLHPPNMSKSSSSMIRRKISRNVMRRMLQCCCGPIVYLDSCE